MNSISHVVHRIVAALLGMMLLVAGLLFAASAVIAASMVAVAALVWARLRGVPIAMRPGPSRGGDVVDVQVREVPEEPDRDGRV